MESRWLEYEHFLFFFTGFQVVFLLTFLPVIIPLLTPRTFFVGNSNSIKY